MQPSERLQGQDAMYADKRPNARRVSLSHVTDCILHKTFFRAGEAGPDPEGPLTICILTMRNGFYIIGKGATIDPTVEFDAALGEQAAYDNALTQIFEKEAYVAMEFAWRDAHAVDPAEKINEAFPGSETIAESSIAESDDDGG